MVNVVLSAGLMILRQCFIFLMSGNSVGRQHHCLLCRELLFACQKF
ncbi:hypothetical protein yaldo0001_27630 [Yersinia aldovae ATCC 35236]|nr:hypothetical protein yaldo0001_27630 [Yersinia aldovae ATCC 35236]